MSDTVAALIAASADPSGTPVSTTAGATVLELPYELTVVQAGATGITNMRYITVLADGSNSIVVTADEFRDYGDTSTYAARKAAADNLVIGLSLL